MTRRILAKTASGTSTQMGGEDLDYINQLLTGTDQSGTDALDIATTWKFRSGKLRLLETGGTLGGSDESYVVAGSTSQASDKTITLPLLTGDDTLAFDGATQTLTRKTIVGGSAATSGTNNYIADLMLYPSHRKITGWIGGIQNNSIGFGQGGTATAGTSTHNITTSGKSINWATSTAQNSQGGYRNTTTGAVARAQNLTFACRFKLNDATSAVRFGVFLNNSSSLPTAGSDDPLGTAQGIGLFKRSTDNTNFVLGHRGSGGTNVYDSTSIAIDTTSTHIFRIRAIESTPTWQYSWDNGVWTTVPGTISTDYPTTTTITPAIYCELTDTSAVPKSFDLYWITADCQEFP